MEAYKQRMISELIELHMRYCAAVNSLFDECITPTNRLLLQRQVKEMCEYEKILHNMLYLALTNTRYDYFFHHANKIGMWCNDEFFNEVIDTESKT